MEISKVGKIVGTHGLKGELKIRSNSDFAKERFQKNKKLIIIDDSKEIEFTIDTVRFHKTNYLVSFIDNRDINLVEKYVGLNVYGYKDEIKLNNNEFLIGDLYDLEVLNYDKVIGKVIEVTSNGKQSILVVQTNNKKVMIPYVDAFIKKVDLNKKQLHVELIEGFLDEN